MSLDKMGYPYNELIAPAVLYMNPGITREEFVRLLDDTHSSHFHNYKPEDSWDYYNTKIEDGKYHGGLSGLAEILGLEYHQRFKEFQQPKIDKNGFVIRKPYVIPASPDKGYKFEVCIHEENVLEEPKLQFSASWSKLKPGDIWEETTLDSERGIVLEIFEEKDTGEDVGPRYYYRMKVKPICPKGRIEKFRSEVELHKKWPEFHPNFIFDWLQEKGCFCIIRAFGKDNFLWTQKQGRYYFNEATFDRIPASFECSGSFGYTDLILTMGAIKHKAWKILSRRGLDHFSQFLKDFPDVVPIYERAVWDSHTSLSAKLQGMSVSDFLRFRMQG